MMNLQKINELFYESEGLLFRKVRCGRRGVLGKSVGTNNGQGYLTFEYNHKGYLVHRILYQIHNNVELECDVVIDHIDNNKHNNTKNNLRLSTSRQNQYNTKIRKNNKTGVKGLYEEMMASGRYRYRATCSRVTKSFEHTENGKQLAIEWLIAKRKELHGEFANDG